MMKFSLCMIVKNEEKSLPVCLESVKDLFDEIIIVDTGSTDRTKTVARTFTDNIYDFPWCDDFSAARNFSFSKATGDYIAWLDADDRLDQPNKAAFLALKSSLSFETDVVMMKYSAARHSDGSQAFYYYRERLVKRLAHFSWYGFVHEVIVPHGNILYSDVCVFHSPLAEKNHSDRNLRLYEAKKRAGYLFNARETYYYARELFEHGQYTLAARQLSAFLEKNDAWYADKIGACLLLYRIYAQSDPVRARLFLCRSLSYEYVTPQPLCLMGDDCKRQNRLEQAIFWYTAALNCPKDYRKDGFVDPDFELYYPALSLCVCYDALGDKAKAKAYNDLAGKVHPKNPEILHNKAYFSEASDASSKTSAELPPDIPTEKGATEAKQKNLPENAENS